MRAAQMVLRFGAQADRYKLSLRYLVSEHSCENALQRLLLSAFY